MFGIFKRKPEVRKQLEQIDESNEWINKDKGRTIEVSCRDHVTGEDFTTTIGPGEKIGLQDGMEPRYARFV